MRRKFLISICVAIFLFTPVFASANVVINEVKISGGSGKSTDEFVELYNNSEASVEVNDWKIYKFTKKPDSPIDKTLIVQLPGYYTMSPFSYFLLAHELFVTTTGTDVPDVTYSGTGGASLASDNTVLLCKADETDVDEVGYGEATVFNGVGPAPDPGTRSISRVDFSDTNNDSVDFIVTDPSPRNKLFVLAPVETPTTTATSTPLDETPTTPTTTAFAVTPPLKINEFLPNPNSGEEWIEIYNLATSSVMIDGLKIFDAVGEIATPTGTIGAGGFFVVELTSSKLNNDGDTITLRDASNTVIDTTSYTTVHKGNSIARSIDGVGSFAETTTLTRGTPNVITAPVVNTPSGGGGGGSAGSPQAQTPVVIQFDIVINELVSDPTDGAVEFVELYNKTNNVVNLAGWWIEEGSGSRSVLSGSIASLGFFVLEKPSGSLNNAGDIVKLFSSSGTEVDKVAYGNWNDGSASNNAVVASDPFSLARKTDGYDTNNDHSNFVITAQITKGWPNVIVLPGAVSNTASTTTSTSVQIQNEKEKNTLPMISILLPEEIVVGEPVEFDASETIDIDDDELSFVWDFGDGSHAYGETVLHEYKEDGTFTISLVVKDGTGQSKETAKVRVNESGQLIVESSENVASKTKIKTKTASTAKGNYLGLVSLDKMSEVSAGDKVKVSGTVAVLPNVFGSQYFYIANGSNGVQVYMNSRKFPELKIGDVVEVSGEISEPYGEKRVKVKNTADIKIVGHQDDVAPAELTTTDLSESIGAFVKLKGEITEIKSTYLYVDDGEGEVKVVFKRGANIGKGDRQIGDLVEIMGVVGQSSSGIQFMPRSQMDIVKVGHVEKDILASSEQADKDKTTETYLTATAGGLTSILISLAAKARGKMAVGLLKRVGGLAMLVVKRKTKV